MTHTDENDVERFTYGEIQEFAFNTNSECESCGRLINRHMWADLDVEGIAVWCSVSEWHKLHPEQ